MDNAQKALGGVALLPHNEDWPVLFAKERERLAVCLGTIASDLEHFGSTAVAGLLAKPVIDMMGKITSLSEADILQPILRDLGYVMIDAGFEKRRFFKRDASDVQPTYHLHLVVCSSWPIKNELLFRDWLVQQPEVARAYEKLKRELAIQFSDNMPAYTAGKNAFIQTAVNDARRSRGLPPEADWKE